MKKILTLTLTTILAFQANAAMVVIGHTDGIDSISASDVSSIYLGKKNKLDNGQSPVLVEMKTGSDERRAFHDLSTKRSDSQLQSSWSRLIFTGKATAPIEVGSYAEVIEKVKSTPNSIGYIDDSLLNADVKVIHKF